MIADSLSFFGASPVLAISAASADFIQSSLVEIVFPALSNKVRVGLASGVGTPLAESDGPMPRSRTFLAMSPVTMNPAIATLSPVSTKTRVARLTAFPGGVNGRVRASFAPLAVQKCPAVVGCLSSQKRYRSGLTLD